MTTSFPVPTPAQVRLQEIHTRAETAIIQAVFAALDEGAERMRQELRAADPDSTYDPQGYLTATLLQKIYCRLCGADPDAFKGGDPKIALAVIHNCRNIARHYWGAETD